jgi:hypothetical protein
MHIINKCYFKILHPRMIYYDHFTYRRKIYSKLVYDSNLSDIKMIMQDEMDQNFLKKI